MRIPFKVLVASCTLAGPLLGGNRLVAAEYRLLFIPKEIDQPFWQKMHAGAEHAAKEMSVEGNQVKIDFNGPSKAADLPGQVKLVETATTQEYDAILLAPLDRAELVAPVERAIARGLRVALVETALDSHQVSDVTGDRNFAAGQMAAHGLATSLGGIGNVILFRHHINAADTEQREQGFLEVMQSDFPGIHLLVTDFHAGPTAAIAQRVVPSLIEQFQDRLDGIFVSSECAGRSVLAELNRRGLRGKVKFVGIEDEGDVLRPALSSGLVNGLVVQDPAAIGSGAVRRMIARLAHQPPPDSVVPGLRLLTPADLEGVNSTSGSLAPRKVGAADDGLLVVPSAQLVMVAVPAGSFIMGSQENERGFRDADSPPTPVTISKAFWLGKFEVTQRQWSRLMGANPSEFLGDSNPVDNVSWNDAVEFCRRVNAAELAAGRLPEGYAYQLPTEAQWEYACRAGDSSPRAGKLDELGWYVGNSGSWSGADRVASDAGSAVWQMTTHPVGQKQPNSWGLYDMYGNVLEWCQDVYGRYTGSMITDPRGSGGDGNRVLRGGGWWTDSEVCLAFSRSHAPANRHHNALGLRLALSPLP